MNRLLITGAAGGLGVEMRKRLAPLAKTLRLSDIVDLGTAGANEELVICDLGNRAAVADLVQGCDGIVHFGGVSTEQPWDPIANANIQGVFNLYEAARLHGKPRILFASSNHATGFYRQDHRIDNTVYPRPDGLYGVSKVFGEAMAHMYHDKFGIETAIVRIGSSFPEPWDYRSLASWLSYSDFQTLITRIFEVPELGCPIIYGASANATTWWDNSNTAWLGWSPKDSSEQFRAKIEATVEKPADDEAVSVWQGGVFTTIHKE
ncbi:MAG: NAD(P)-dependent oxidoreductase [Silicimonas sp.]|nr:NAD(P)-dependent oxidoreductase [Silicimonas sp.]